MFPLLPQAHAMAAMALTAFALFLFTRDRIPLETSSLLVLIALVLGFELFPYRVDGEIAVRPADFFVGFGHEALITIGALMICGKALETTGALQPLGRVMAQAWLAQPQFAFLATLLLAALLSAFLNNTPIVVMMLPILVGACMRANINPSGVLMPVGLATILGGMGTTIGTSTNLLVVAISADLGAAQLDMFDFTLPVAIAATIAMLYLWGFAPRLLPARTPPMSDTSPRVFSAMLHIGEDSYASGRSLVEVLKKTNNRMRIDRIERGEGLFIVKLPSVTIQAGDRLYVSDTPDRLKDFEQLLGATLFSATDDEHPVREGFPLDAAGQQLAEVVVTPGSPLHHRTLKSTRFVARYKLVPLAIHQPRQSATETTDIGDITLRSADVLLVQGSSANIRELKNSGTMLVLDGTTDLPHTKRAPLAAAIMIGVVLVAAFGLLPISVSAAAGMGLMLLTRCLVWEDAVEALNSKVVLVIVASLGLGLALLRTGAADYIAEVFVYLAAGLPVPFILSGFMLLMSVLTNVVTNNAAAVTGTPVAISIAQQLGVDPTAFVLAVIFGANMSFATPIGYQTNLLVLSAGGYEFSDFLRVGVPLTLIIWATFSVVLPALYAL